MELLGCRKSVFYRPYSTFKCSSPFIKTMAENCRLIPRTTFRLPLLAIPHGSDASKSSEINTSTIALFDEMSDGRVGLESLNFSEQFVEIARHVFFNHAPPTLEIVPGA